MSEVEPNVGVPVVTSTDKGSSGEHERIAEPSATRAMRAEAAVGRGEGDDVDQLAGVGRGDRRCRFVGKRRRARDRR